jgi:hypothetical protein
VCVDGSLGDTLLHNVVRTAKVSGGFADLHVHQNHEGNTKTKTNNQSETKTVTKGEKRKPNQKQKQKKPQIQIRIKIKIKFERNRIQKDSRTYLLDEIEFADCGFVAEHITRFRIVCHAQGWLKL